MSPSRVHAVVSPAPAGPGILEALSALFAQEEEEGAEVRSSVLEAGLSERDRYVLAGGFPGASRVPGADRNRAARAGTAEFLLFLDAGFALPRGWLRSSLAAFARRPDLVMIGARAPGDARRRPPHRGALLFRGRDFFRLGGFDSGLPDPSWGALDWAWRLARRGEAFALDAPPPAALLEGDAGFPAGSAGALALAWKFLPLGDPLLAAASLGLLLEGGKASLDGAGVSASREPPFEPPASSPSNSSSIPAWQALKSFSAFLALRPARAPSHAPGATEEPFQRFCRDFLGPLAAPALPFLEPDPPVRAAPPPRSPLPDKPSATILVVNRGRRDLTIRCLESLEAAGKSAGRTETIVVDNASSDGSADAVRARFPAARVIENPRNDGFAGPVAKAGREAGTDLLALVNNDVRLPPGWLDRMIAVLRDRPEAGCAGSCLLEDDGRAVDFWGGVLNWEGRGFQALKGQPLPAETPPDGAPSFFACGGACVFRLDALREAGGVDGSFFAYYEDVDACWRLRLAGWTVAMAYPEGVLHRGGATGTRLPPGAACHLRERNLLKTLLRNEGPDALARVLPAFAALWVERLDVLGSGAAGLQGPADARGMAAAAGAVAAELGAVLEARRATRAGRRVEDAELLPLFGDPFRPVFPDLPPYRLRQARLAASLGVAELFGSRPATRVLFVCHDVVGDRMAGPAIRTLEAARALGDEFEVEVAVPEESGVPPWTGSWIRYGRDRDEELRRSAERADAVVLQGFTLADHPWMAEIDAPIAVDVGCLFTIENFEFFLGHDIRGNAMAAAGEVHLGVVRGLLRRGDFFVCASEAQRDFWLGMLHAEGRLDGFEYARDPTGRSLIDVVPFGLPAEPPRGPGALKGKWKGIGPDDFVLLWAGGIYEWFDPETLVRAVDLALREDPRIRLFFMGTRHPNPAIPAMAVLHRTQRLARERGLLDRAVFFNDWVPYARRGEFLSDADVGVSIHRDSLETRYSFRTRILDYLWAGLPVVTTEGDFFADLLGREGAGFPVPAGDEKALAGAILRLARDRELRARAAARSAALRERFPWPKVTEPLRRFLRAPSRNRPSEGRAPAPGPEEDDPAALRERVALLEARLHNVDRLFLAASRVPFARLLWRAWKRWKGW